MDLSGPKGVIVNKLEETVKIYGHKVSIEIALESRISFITPASEIDLAFSSVESCLLRELLQLPACLPSMEAAFLVFSHPIANIVLGAVPRTYPPKPSPSPIHV
jgi:hypothetical protein